MYIKKSVKSPRLWLFSSFVSIATFYLLLVWKTTANLDNLTTACLFWGVILWLLWRKTNITSYCSDPISSFLGLLLLGLVLSKTLTLFAFESSLIPLLPITSVTVLVLIDFGFRGLIQYKKELFLAWFLFFPTGVIGLFIDSTIHITVINAKVATYLLYYCGFNVISQGNEVILSVPTLGNFKAIVDYPCAGIPMILLILKLALLLISCVSLTKKQQILLPILSLILGFSLGVIRVCILTILIPYHTHFSYWHGTQGSQFFSTLAIIIFSGYCYWTLSKNQKLSVTSN